MKTSRFPVYLIAFALCIQVACERASVPGERQAASMRRKLEGIASEIRDLTSIQAPLSNVRFSDLRDAITLEQGYLVASLITNGQMRATATHLALLVLTGLKEDEYWRVTGDLLSTTIDDELKAVILKPYCYGPGYARAFREPAWSNELFQVRRAYSSPGISNLVESILSGVAEKEWEAVVAEPDAFGWNPEYLMRFKIHTP